MQELAHLVDIQQRRSRARATVTMEQRRGWARALLAPLDKHPRQLALLPRIEHKTKRIVVQANRRGGKTEGIGRILAGLAIVYPGYVVRIITTNLAAPTTNWLEREGDRGLLGILDELGVPYEVRRVGGGDNAIKRIMFPWGSCFLVHDMDNLRAMERKRGFRAHVFWGDEAQLLELLAQILTKITASAGLDFRAIFLLSGTPGPELGSLFHRVSTGREQSQWLCVRFYAWDNPAYGETDAERWGRIMDEVIEPFAREFGLTAEDVEILRCLTKEERELIAVGQDEDLRPELRDRVKTWHADLLREQFGRWVEEAADYVYAVHGTAAERVYWAHVAEPRFTEDQRFALPVLPTLAQRMEALPKIQIRRVWRRKEWRAIAGFDLGYFPDPFAWWVGVYSPEEDTPSCYEVASGKLWRLADSQMLDEIARVLDELREEQIWIAAAVADVTGQRKGTGVDWSWKLAERFPRGSKGLIAPNKSKERLQYRLVNVDLGRRLFLARGGAADIEARYLRWRSFDPSAPREPEVDKYRQVTLPDGTQARPGDHCLDCMRYAYYWMITKGHEAQPETEEQATPEAQVKHAHSEHRRRELRG